MNVKSAIIYLTSLRTGCVNKIYHESCNVVKSDWYEEKDKDLMEILIITSSQNYYENDDKN